MKKEKEEIRLNKYLSEIGYCSRRVADKLIDEGRIKINGSIVVLGQKVKAGDRIKVNGLLVENNKEKSVYIAFNKPTGIVCTTDTYLEKDNIIDYINYPTRIYPIGRLDKMSEGLILLTNDGDIVNKILRARNNHEKEYIVKVNRPITSEFVNNLKKGVPILGTITKKCEVEQIHKNQFRIILTQGLNRQIRRMCEHFEFRVKKLERIRIININLDIPRGKWRHLNSKEISDLKNL